FYKLWIGDLIILQTQSYIVLIQARNFNCISWIFIPFTKPFPDYCIYIFQYQSHMTKILISKLNLYLPPFIENNPKENADNRSDIDHKCQTKCQSQYPKI